MSQSTSNIYTNHGKDSPLPQDVEYKIIGKKELPEEHEEDFWDDMDWEPTVIRCVMSLVKMRGKRKLLLREHYLVTLVRMERKCR